MTEMQVQRGSASSRLQHRERHQMEKKSSKFTDIGFHDDVLRAIKLGYRDEQPVATLCIQTYKWVEVLTAGRKKHGKCYRPTDDRIVEIELQLAHTGLLFPSMEAKLHSTTAITTIHSILVDNEEKKCIVTMVMGDELVFSIRGYKITEGNALERFIIPYDEKYEKGIDEVLQRIKRMIWVAVEQRGAEDVNISVEYGGKNQIPMDCIKIGIMERTAQGAQ